MLSTWWKDQAEKTNYTRGCREKRHANRFLGLQEGSVKKRFRVIMTISLFIEKFDNLFGIFLSSDWKLREVTALTQNIESAVMLHQDFRIMSGHH